MVHSRVRSEGRGAVQESFSCSSMARFDISSASAICSRGSGRVSGPLRGGGAAAAAGATPATGTAAAAGSTPAPRSPSSARAAAAAAGAAARARTALAAAVLRQRLHREGAFEGVALLLAPARRPAWAARAATLLVAAELLLHRLGHQVDDVLEVADLLRAGYRLVGREHAHQPDALGLVAGRLERVPQALEPLAGGAGRLRDRLVQDLLRRVVLRLLGIRPGRRPLLRLRILGGRSCAWPSRSLPTTFSSRRNWTSGSSCVSRSLGISASPGRNSCGLGCALAGMWLTASFASSSSAASVALSSPPSGGASFRLSCGSTSGCGSGTGGGTRSVNASFGSCLRASATALAAMRMSVPENSVSVFMGNGPSEGRGALHTTVRSPVEHRAGPVRREAKPPCRRAVVRPFGPSTTCGHATTHCA